jgi:hypothetical protein
VRDVLLRDICMVFGIGIGIGIGGTLKIIRLEGWTWLPITLYDSVAEMDDVDT